jgi:DNA-binding transcriptional ArsR family regulator
MESMTVRTPAMCTSVDLSQPFFEYEIEALAASNRAFQLVCRHCNGRVLLINHADIGKVLTCSLCAREAPIVKTPDVLKTRKLPSVAIKHRFLRDIHHEVVAALYEEERGLPTAVIASIIDRTQRSVGQAANKLVDIGLVELAPDEKNDDQGRRYRLTREGEECIQ